VCPVNVALFFLEGDGNSFFPHDRYYDKDKEDRQRDHDKLLDVQLRVHEGGKFDPVVLRGRANGHSVCIYLYMYEEMRRLP
jgi:hypothetical protein